MEIGKNTYHRIRITEQIRIINSSSTLKAEEIMESGAQCRLTDLTLRPFFTFLRVFVLERRIFKGCKGAITSMLKAYEEFASYLKLWEQEHVNGGGDK